MDAGILGAFLGLVLILLLAGGFWVGMSLFAVGILGIAAFSSAPAGAIMATTSWGQSWSWSLTALPLFIWMGEILFRTRLAEDMFKGLAPWMTKIPGRLMHVNVVGCGIFAAVSGSSAATTATIGRITIPELAKRGYDERMSLGTLAGSATLGLLIPPSIILIVYGVAADVSISRLFIAGVIPGLVLIALFMATIMVWSLLHPSKVPPAEFNMSFGQKLRATGNLIPIILLIVGVIGSIYVGIATATEAAAVGVAGALLLSAVTGSLNWETFKSSLLGATCTSCMIAFILAGAAFLSVAMGFTGIPRHLAEWIAGMQLSPIMLLFALTLFFAVLGCFLDGISIVVLTVAVIMPMVEQAGIDLIWFGIYIVVVVEMSQITPPIGLNLFVIQSLTGRDLLYLARAALPFFLVMVVMVVLLILVPELATYLPAKMTRG
ncbi:TRAP-type C4-dicarboxylate transport system, large permease component [alpha proteobacterium BAL199]|jgi:C4-dicarboxylate transporter, DctM subunit|nr:TRAP-type C4-dicarboxylate transport system, large permease component [alpha proteobacterium BAL199]